MTLQFDGTLPSLVPMRNAASKINAAELARGSQDRASWHDDYKNSPYIYVGSLPYDVSEDDLKIVFSQFGVVTKVNLVRDKETQKSKGFAFLAYSNHKSAILAVDNFDGIDVSRPLD
jgi:RNA-binding motif X-linked protein 2